MNKERGISTIVVIILVVVLAGAAYAVVNRSVLKSFFQTGDKPAQKEDRTNLDQPFETGDVPTADKIVGEKPTDSQSKSVTESGARATAPNDAPVTKTAPVTNESPKNNATLPSAESEKGISFRWTPVVPKPQESVTYRLKVWQLMQGQSGAQAMRSNQPIVTKDVDNVTQATASNIYTGPCRPPYLCDFIWSVSTVQGGKITSESSPSTFSVNGSTDALGTPPKETVTPTEVKSEVQSGGTR